MNDNKPNLPILKLADNIPVAVTLDTQPEQAKYIEKEMKTREGKPFTSKSYTYFVVATDPMTQLESKMVWFAKPKEHEELVKVGALLGSSYSIVNQKYPGDKYASFIVRDVNSPYPPVSTSEDSPPLEEYLKDPEAGTLVSSSAHTPISANKTQASHSPHKDGQVMGMCYKIACDKELKGAYMGEDFQRVNGLTRALYANFQSLMSE